MNKIWLHGIFSQALRKLVTLLTINKPGTIFHYPKVTTDVLRKSFTYKRKGFTYKRISLFRVSTIARFFQIYVNERQKQSPGGDILLIISQNSQENSCDGVSFLIKLQIGGLFCGIPANVEIRKAVGFFGVHRHMRYY